jgi:hypothetical protein
VGQGFYGDSVWLKRKEKSGIKRPSYGFIFLRGLLLAAFFEISRKGE